MCRYTLIPTCVYKHITEPTSTFGPVLRVMFCPAAYRATFVRMEIGGGGASRFPQEDVS